LHSVTIAQSRPVSDNVAGEWGSNFSVTTAHYVGQAFTGKGCEKIGNMTFYPLFSSSLFLLRTEIYAHTGVWGLSGVRKKLLFGE